jgi:hypothetical protein
MNVRYPLRHICRADIEPYDPHPVVRGRTSAVVAAAYNQSGAGYMTEVGNSLQLATAPSVCPLLRGQPPGRSTASR